jgi:predicted nucleic acid-binding protein
LILKEAKSATARIQIITSIITIAEVVKPKGCAGLTPQQEQQIDDFFENEWIIPVNADRSIMEQARGLQRQHGLKVRDAIHVASAIYAEATVIETYDSDLLIWHNQVRDNHGKALPIRKPSLGYPAQIPLGTP